MSPSGSLYWRTAFGVFRISDHWGLGIKSCDWYLRDFAGQKDEGCRTASAFCSYGHFLRDIQRQSRHFMVAPDGTETPTHPASFVKRGFSIREEIVVEGFYPGYSECCAVKG